MGLGALAACASSGHVGTLDAQAELARGGRLYDAWMVETAAADPATAHPAYPADGGYASKPATTWRCKECHGWDYLGADGAYAAGKHATGIRGIAAWAGRSAADAEALLRGDGHGFGAVLADADLRAVARFVAEGQVDMDALIDRATGDVAGDEARGRAYYDTICAACHRSDGRAVDMPVLGEVSRSNPLETLHKILNGQPGSTMPTLRALDRQVTLRLLGYSRTRPD